MRPVSEPARPQGSNVRCALLWHCVIVEVGAEWVEYSAHLASADADGEVVYWSARGRAAMVVIRWRP